MEIDEENSKIIEDVRNTARNTIKICKENGILGEFLGRKESEVERIMMSTMLRLKENELYGEKMKAEGMAEGKAKGKIDAVLSLLKKGKLTEEEAIKETGMNRDELRKFVEDSE